MPRKVGHCSRQNARNRIVLNLGPLFIVTINVRTPVCHWNAPRSQGKYKHCRCHFCDRHAVHHANVNATLSHIIIYKNITNYKFDHRFVSLAPFKCL
jgi:hypothetical protein